MPIQFLDNQFQPRDDPNLLPRHMALALSYGYPIVTKLPAHERPLAIVGGGPSVKDDVDELRAWKDAGKEIWAANGALDWLVEQGITPDAWVMIDPMPVMTQFLGNPPDITYYLATFAHPDVFEALTGKNIVLWHVGGKEIPPPPGYGSVGGGPTIMSRAPMLAFCLGFRDVHLYGADSSYDEGDHAYHDPNYLEFRADLRRRVQLVRFNLDGVRYLSDMVMAHQVAYFQAIHDWFTHHRANFEIHGRGLGPALLKAKMFDPAFLETL